MAKGSTKWLIGGLLLLAAGGGTAYYGKKALLDPNVIVTTDASKQLYIRHGETFDDVVEHLQSAGNIKDMESFKQTAKLKKYPDHIKSGCYTLTNGMSNLDLVRMLASGNQKPVKLTFNNKRTAEDLAGRLAEVLEMDSATVLNCIYDPKRLSSYGLDSSNATNIFIPNTYEVYWDIAPEKLMDKMKDEYDKFWNDKRKQKLVRTGLDQRQVSILASIVEEEQNQKLDEQPIIAGLYINRLRKGMKLESDPTVKYAVKDFSLRRILNVHLSTDSPYNTYMYAGLPPGPIRIPSIKAIDAVLNYKESDYIYMCAKEDFSGYHNFAKNGSEHAENAARYHKALNQQRIFK